MSGTGRDDNQRRWRRLFIGLVLLVLGILLLLVLRPIDVPVSVLPQLQPEHANANALASEVLQAGAQEIEVASVAAEHPLGAAPESPEESEAPPELEPPSGYTKFQEPCSGEAGNAMELFIGIYTECEDQIYGYSIKTN